jgi:HK97 gp10 family phage protein
MIVKVEGLSQLAAALDELPKRAARSTLQRVLKKAATPTRDAAQAKAPRLTGSLQKSVVIGTRLTRRQKSDAKKDGKFFAEIHVGTASRHGIPEEFGTFKDVAQPFMRPAWEANQAGALKIIETELGGEIEKTAARLARKAAKG